MSDRYMLYSAAGSGGVAVEAALTLMDAPYELIEAPTYDPDQAAAGDVILPANPMRQVPALVFPSGEVMTESAAILVRLGELHPRAALAPTADDPRRSAFLRSRGSFHLLQVCNQWMARALRAAGVDVNARAAWLAGPLIRQVRKVQPTACPASATGASRPI